MAKRKPKVEEDDLEIPRFLWRDEQRTPEHKAKVARIIQQAIDPTQREWVMPKHNVPIEMPQEDELKLNALVENPDAKVTVHLRDPDGNPLPEQQFKNLAAFEAWYSPKAHHFIGANSKPEFTDISIDLTGRGADPRQQKAPKETKPKAGATIKGSAVWADGKQYRSVLVAFQELKLEVKRHQKFRAELKKARKLTYTEGKRSVAFEYK
jgi:hypothetical protein